MQKQDYKLINTVEAFKSLETAYRYYSKEINNLALSDNLELKKITRDSVIQRFEYTVELLWKLLFNHLKSKFLLDNLVASPKLVFKEAFTMKLLDEAETEKAIIMINDRNLTSHMYKEEIAEKLIKKIPQHIKLIKRIIEKIKSN